jgi:hypothetical protein
MPEILDQNSRSRFERLIAGAREEYRIGQPLLTPEFTPHGFETSYPQRSISSSVRGQRCDACIISANRWVFNSSIVVHLHFTKDHTNAAWLKDRI